MVKKERKSNIELLRIIAMIMIVVSHYALHSGVNINDLPLGVNRFLLEVVSLGDIGVILYVFITGYFSINSKKPFNLKKMIILIFEVVFYSLCIFIIFCLLGRETFTLKAFIHNVFPITFQMYWFMSVYILLYLFIPYINILLNNCDRRKHLTIIIISLFVFSFLGTLTNRLNYANELIQFIMFYIIGAYFGKYKDSFFSNKKNNFICFILVTFIMVISILLIDFMKIKIPMGIESIYLFKRTKITSIIFSITFFNIFNNSKIFSNKFINLLASSTLGIYLIHENYLVSGVLWTNIIHVSDYVSSIYLFIHMIFSVFIVFIICLIIDLIRKNTIEVIISKLYDYIENIFKRLSVNK